MSARAHVLVVGGGVAGISSAVHLARKGFAVTLIEQRKLLGGRAGSFAHKIGADELLDTGQHVLMGCCTELKALYELIGAKDLIRFDDQIHFADARGGRAIMSAAALPSPMHMLPSLIRFPMLRMGQKMQIVRAMLAIYLAGEKGRDRNERITFAQFLREHGQSDETIRDYWDVICISALNEACDTASAKYAMQVFGVGLMGGRSDYHLGYARAPLASLYSNLPGVSVRAGAAAREILFGNGRVTGVSLVGGEKMAADWVVLATSAPSAVSLLEPRVDRTSWIEAMSKLQYRPIVGVHLLYDRPIELANPVALLGTKLQWIFPNEKRRELVHGVISAADLLGSDDGPEAFDAELRAIFPQFRDAMLVDSVVVKESRATFRPLPGTDRLRPMQRTGVPGLTLAGDYTQTNWPSTMESAARSGRLAAGDVESHLR